MPPLHSKLVFAKHNTLNLLYLALELLVGIHHIGYSLAAVEYGGVVTTTDRRANNSKWRLGVLLG